ncbi:hypothetical protein GJ744_009305 [Endocarpon pusillum]|uniref:3-methylitaconate isomerase n=1 Tax=Endocarpon pusillum TaxID=364733 RepID=A0A8H7E3X3_9EURO|nr:hypothetical protein GJ744_009305 [Endocarpon pusillum]
MNKLSLYSRVVCLSPHYIPYCRLKNSLASTFSRRTLRGVQTSQHSIPAAYWRGGTSRAVIFQRRDLPVDESEWPFIFLRVLGSPDRYHQQIDGLGAGISSLSKVCIVSPSTHLSADIDYTFAAVGITSSDVDVSGNCGNILSAIGPYAYNHKLVPPASKSSVTVRIRNTNTSKIIHSTFPVTNDRIEAATGGDCSIAGVSGTGAEISLSFQDPAGSKTGTLLPSGNAIDKLDGIEATCMDAANPCIFAEAADLGVDGTELPDEISDNLPLLQRLEKIRRLGGRAMGMCHDTQNAPRCVPKIAIVSKPATHKVINGTYLEQGNVDIVARVMSDRQPHRTIPLTVALCMAVAATVRASIVEALVGPKKVKKGVLTIGHPSGTIEVGVEKDEAGNVLNANVKRTARSLMEGVVYY